MLILAIDLGKTKSLACWYQTDDTKHEFRTVPTRPGDFHTLLSDRPVDRVMIEICDAAGWIVDLCARVKCHFKTRSRIGRPRVMKVNARSATGVADS
ncbi:MAG TPA: hypothetical protein VGR35_19325 [Tepidisphaeraceae bacterium]|nr:hypothetical protein [Tepidisphaeraceae bacterium]